MTQRHTKLGALIFSKHTYTLCMRHNHAGGKKKKENTGAKNALKVPEQIQAMPFLIACCLEHSPCQRSYIKWFSSHHHHNKHNELHEKLLSNEGYLVTHFGGRASIGGQRIHIPQDL